MPTEFTTASLGDFVEFQRGFDLPQQKRTIGNYPIVSSSGITDYHSESMVASPGVVTGRYGTIGKVFYLEQPFWPLNTTLWIKDFKGNYPKFVYYFLHTLDFNSCADKSSVPGVNRNDLHAISVRIPDIQTQQVIAEILSCLDDKIELNWQMNKTLEMIAQALFKSWFVDFDPVKAKSEGYQPEGLSNDIAALFPDSFEDDKPKGWSEKSIYSCAEYINGAAYKNMHFSDAQDALPVVKIAELKDGVGPSTKYTSTDLGEKYLINTGEILFSWSGSPETSIDTFLWVGGSAWLNQHIFKVVTQLPELRPFIFFLLKHLKPMFIAIARDKQTTGLGHVTVQDLKRLKIVYPSIEVLRAFAEIATPILERLQHNLEQIALLSGLRDELLPRLISGKLRVGEISEIEEALI